METTESSLLMDSDVVKQKPPWSVDEEPPDQPPPVSSPAPPMSDHTAGSLLSQDRGGVCQWCSASFVLDSSLQLHMASLHGEPLSCTEQTELPASSALHGLSSNNTDEKRELMCPVKEKPPDQPPPVSSPARPMSDLTAGSLLSQDRGGVCQRCSASFVLDSSLELHVASLHGEKLQAVSPVASSSEGGDAGNENAGDLTEGKVEGKRTDKGDNGDIGGKDGERKRRQLPCDLCSKTFNHAGKLKRHRLVHAGRKPYVCDVCRKTFTQASSLKRHMIIHTGERPYKCPQCNADFTRSAHLETHIKSVHGGERPYACDICGSAFSEPGNLKTHKRTHTGERPYKCLRCHADFTRFGALQKHTRSIHLGERPHVCDICHTAFSESCNLKRHSRTHTGKKPYKCTDCGKDFAGSGNLKRHRLIHTGEKPHACPHCPAAFTQPHSLKTHVQKLHQ